MVQSWKEALKKKLRSPGFEGHSSALTRRELVRLGLLAGGASFVPVSWLERALAETGARPTVPFLTFDLAGGASMTGNFLVGKADGPEDLCANYRAHGWNPRATDALDKTFGIPMSKARSQMLAGLKRTLPAEIVSRGEDQSFVKMASFCHFSLDDTNTNRSSSLSLIARAGLAGRFVRGGFGLVASMSGGNSDSYLRDGRFRPTYVSKASDLVTSTSFGVGFEQLPSSTRAQMFRQLREAARGRPELEAVYDRLSGSGLTRPELDPSRHPEVARLYGLRPGSLDAGTLSLEAAVVYNVIAGNVGPSVLTTGGCDYHDNTQTTGDAKDLEIGERIGRAIHVAHVLRRPLMFQIVTDGGVYAPTSDSYERRWVGDANQHSLSVIGYYRPDGGVRLIKTQVGSYTDGGQVDQRTPIGSGPEKMALATFANYLALNELLGQFETASGARVQSREIDEWMVFG